MQIGLFEIPEQISFPKTHRELRRQLRALARSMDLRLEFVERERLTYSYCDPVAARAVVITNFRSYRYPRLETAFSALHEIGHWIDYNNGLFQDYYPRRDSKRIINPTDKNILRLGVRAEQHCDRLARRMLWSMYGKTYNTPHTYDNVTETRASLIKNYKIEL